MDLLICSFHIYRLFILKFLSVTFSDDNTYMYRQAYTLLLDNSDVNYIDCYL